jgi:hypothetical protein
MFVLQSPQAPDAYDEDSGASVFYGAFLDFPSQQD